MNYYQNPYYLQPQQTQPQQIMSGGFVSVPNELAARNYPVAHGNSVTFKDENAPYVYVKTVGFSQMDVPVFEKYRLIREVEASSNGFSSQGVNDTAANAENGKIDALEGRIDAMKRDIDELMLFKAELEGGDGNV